MRARWGLALLLVAASATAAMFFLAHALSSSADASARRAQARLLPEPAALHYRHALTPDAQLTAAARHELDDGIAGLEDRARTVIASPIDLTELADLHFRRAKLTGAVVDYATAEQLAKRSLAALAVDNGAALVMARLHNSRHEFRQAIALALPFGRKPAATSVLATAYLALGELPAASNAAEALVQAQPTSASLLLRALVMQAQGRDEEAAFDFTRAALSEEPGDVQEAARLRSLWARFLLRRGELQGAGQLIDEALRIAPGYPLALAQRGELLLRSGDAAAAIPSFEQAFASSRQVRYLIDQARAEQLAGKRATATALRTQVEHLVRAELGDAAPGTGFGHRLDLVEILTDLADLGTGAGDARLAEAITLGRLEVEHRPSAETHFQLARALARAGNDLDSHEHVQAALATGAREPQYYELAARLEVRRHNTARAALYSRLARELDPRSSGWRQAGMEMP
jgi:tetratricopeptide (TPR) repeat protein